MTPVGVFLFLIYISVSIFAFATAWMTIKMHRIIFKKGLMNTKLRHSPFVRWMQIACLVILGVIMLCFAFASLRLFQ